MVLAATLAIASMIALGLALSWRSADQEQIERVSRANCEAIEALKQVVRPDPFDLPMVRRLLVDLNIDPQSERGKRLIRQARKANVEEREQLAPGTC